MRILVTGASGFAGSLLVPRLTAEGHEVRALGRDTERVRSSLAASAAGARTQSAQTPVEVVRGDALSGEGLDRAVDGVEVVYYLIHSMERSGARAAPFAERERISAEKLAQAASRAGVRRIVYLGGLTPRAAHEEDTSARAGSWQASRHLASREQVESILLSAVEDSLALRASIVIGARSRSFRLLVQLVERMPILTLPAWQRFRTQPIDARDAIAMLAACASARPPIRTIDIGGPDILSYGEMLTRIAELMLLGRPAVRLKVNLTSVTARVAAAITGEAPELVLPLMEGLQGDLLPADHHASELLGVRLHSFDRAVEHSLAEWERSGRLAAR